MSREGELQSPCGPRRRANCLYAASVGFNETVQVTRTTLSSFPVALADGQNWTQPYTFWLDNTGLWKVEVLLFKGRDLTGVYRELHFYVTVT